MKLLRHVWLSVLLLGGCGEGATDPGPSPPPPPPPPGTLRIMMLGNSLTSTWDVPGIIADLAAGIGEPRPIVTSFAPANYSLQDHWNRASTRAALEAGEFDWLVMQQGPTTQVGSAANLLDYSQRWAQIAKPRGIRPGLYVAWPDFGGNIDASINNYSAAAQTNDLALFPAAHAFREAFRVDPNIPIYSADGFHPTRHGAWLAALTIAAVIYSRSPEDFPNIFPTIIVPAEERLLRDAAIHAVNNFGRP